jgi:hypothetical protein
LKLPFFPADIEVKSAEHSINKLKEAAGQTARRNHLLGRLHADILQSNWSYVRAVALPMIVVEDAEKGQSSRNPKPCTNCRRFILDKSCLQDIPGWMAWLLGHQKEFSFPVDQQYKNILTRIIGFLLVSDCQPPFTKFSLDERLQQTRLANEMAVVGQRDQGQGVSSEQPYTEDVNVFKENSNRVNPVSKPTHLGSLKTVVLWNRDQLSVLLSGVKKIILNADFGCGKTLLLKSYALHLANKEEPEKREIIFVSVTAARTQVDNSFDGHIYCINAID